MDNEIIKSEEILLPKIYEEAKGIIQLAKKRTNEVLGLGFIEAVDEQTNAAATENRKIIKKEWNAINEMCDTIHKTLKSPADNFRAIWKGYEDNMDSLYKKYTGTLGAYGLKVQEEARKKAQEEADRKNAEIKAQIDAENKKRAEEAEAARKLAEETGSKEQIAAPELVEFVPVEAAPVLGSKVNTGFASVSVKKKIVGQIVDLEKFISWAFETQNTHELSEVLKVDQVKLNAMLSRHKADGINKSIPGVFSEVVPDVRGGR